MRKAPLPKPDKLLRTRPLSEVNAALARLNVVLHFHPDPVVVELPLIMCVCGKGERNRDGDELRMVQCDECYEWFHFDCVQLDDDCDVAALEWKCEWCTNGADHQGKQRWTTGRKKAKLRHVNDAPRARGAKADEEPPARYSAAPTWDGKVTEIKELARREAVKKRKLHEAAESLVGKGGHHLVDAEGLGGLELRAVDECLVDDFINAGIIDDEMQGDD